MLKKIFALILIICSFAFAEDITPNTILDPTLDEIQISKPQAEKTTGKFHFGIYSHTASKKLDDDSAFTGWGLFIPHKKVNHFIDSSFLFQINSGGEDKANRFSNFHIWHNFSLYPVAYFTKKYPKKSLISPYLYTEIDYITGLAETVADLFSGIDSNHPLFSIRYGLGVNFNINQTSTVYFKIGNGSEGMPAQYGNFESDFQQFGVNLVI